MKLTNLRFFPLIKQNAVDERNIVKKAVNWALRQIGKRNHTRLGRFLRSLGEKAAADWWEALDLTRQAGWYGGEPDPADVQKTVSFLEQIRLWATQ